MRSPRRASSASPAGCPKRVVVALEAVEVEEREDQRGAGARGRQGRIEIAHQRAAVRQAREHVAQCLAPARVQQPVVLPEEEQERRDQQHDDADVAEARLVRGALGALRIGRVRPIDQRERRGERAPGDGCLAVGRRPVTRGQGAEAVDPVERGVVGLQRERELPDRCGRRAARELGQRAGDRPLVAAHRARCQGGVAAGAGAGRERRRLQREERRLDRRRRSSAVLPAAAWCASSMLVEIAATPSSSTTAGTRTVRLTGLQGRCP